jgi:hypothetical protein
MRSVESTTSSSSVSSPDMTKHMDTMQKDKLIWIKLQTDYKDSKGKSTEEVSYSDILVIDSKHIRYKIKHDAPRPSLAGKGSSRSIRSGKDSLKASPNRSKLAEATPVISEKSSSIYTFTSTDLVDYEDLFHLVKAFLTRWHQDAPFYYVALDVKTLRFFLDPVPEDDKVNSSMKQVISYSIVKTNEVSPSLIEKNGYLHEFRVSSLPETPSTQYTIFHTKDTPPELQFVKQRELIRRPEVYGRLAEEPDNVSGPQARYWKE